MSKLAWTVDAVADELGKSPSYVRQLIRDNKLAAKRDGKTPLVLTDSLRAYLDGLPDV